MGRYRRQGCRRSDCPKLESYWHFHGCRYDKISRTCSEPDHIDGCPLPSHQLRNGRLNQMAYSLFLFIRDIADGDLVGWIDRQFQAADDPASPNRLAELREGLIGPLREVYGVSDKVLTMSLSCILLAAPERLRLWREVGASMLVGLEPCQDAGADQKVVHQGIDGNQSNPEFPQPFPRFVQHAPAPWC